MTNQVIHKCLGKKFKFYLWVEGRTKPLASALDKILSFLTYGWTDEPSHPQVPWQNSKSSHLRVEGRTKSPKSALNKILSLSSYGWTNEPSHL